MRRLSIVIMLLSVAIMAHAQHDSFNAPQVFSPDASSLGTYGKIPVNYYTGKPNIKVPITELRAKGHELPIYLTYDASGHRPDQHPGWAGLGWSLHAGGCINRIVRGRKDEISKAENDYIFMGAVGVFKAQENPGYLYRAEYLQNRNWEVSRDSLGYDLVSYTSDYDLAPDEFQIVTDDINASFYITKYGGPHDVEIAIVSQGEDDFTVDLTLGSESTIHTAFYSLPVQLYAHIREIKITNKNGDIYTFGGDNYSVEYSYSPIPQYAQGVCTYEWRATAMANTWHLRRIDYADGESIKFSYTQFGQPIVARWEDHMEVATFGQNMNSSDTRSSGRSPTYTAIRPSYLAKIESALSKDVINIYNHESQELEQVIDENTFNDVVVNLNASAQLPTFSQVISQNYYARLDSIVTSRGKYEFLLSDDTTKRLRLAGIVLKDKFEDIVGTYQMEYNPVMLPEYGSNMTDRWGFYNGLNYSSVSYENLYDYRVPVLAYCQAEILTKLIYPTGGYTEFEYELHDYSSVLDPYGSNPSYLTTETGTAGGLRIKKIINYDGEKFCTRSFQYGQGASSGTLTRRPIFYNYLVVDTSGLNISQWWLQLNSPNTPPFQYVLASEGGLLQIPMSDGGVVTYSKVVERRDDDAKTVYEYYGREDFPDTPVFGSKSNYYHTLFHDTVTSFSLFRGLVKRIKYIDANDSLIKKEEFSYLIDTTLYIKSVDFQNYFESPPIITYDQIRASTYTFSLNRRSFNKIFSSFPALQCKTTTLYPDNVGTPQIITTTYAYGNHRLLTEEYSSVRNGGSVSIKTEYTSDGQDEISSAMRQKNMYSYPLESWKSVNGKVSSSHLYQYEPVLLGAHPQLNTNIVYMPKAEASGTFVEAVDTEDYQWYKDAHLGSFWFWDWEIMEYDDWGNPLETESRKESRIRTRYLWSEDGVYLRMIGKNASSGTVINYNLEQQYSDITLFDFEDQLLSPMGFNSEHCCVGGYRLNVLINPDRTYYCDYWMDSGTGWRYYKEPYSGGIKSIGPFDGNTKIDHIRVFPSDSQVESYTWFPNVGVRCIIDNKGIARSFEYDDIGRLSLVRDSEGYIIKEYGYYYFSQE